MGWFTAFPEDVYQENRGAEFEAAPGFTLAAAGALVWAAQLAYEVNGDGKLDRILEKWGWRKKAVLSGRFASKLPLVSTKGFVAEGRSGLIIAFAGTEPTDLLNWITDFAVYRSAAGVADALRSSASCLPQRTRVARFTLLALRGVCSHS